MKKKEDLKSIYTPRKQLLERRVPQKNYIILSPSITLIPGGNPGLFTLQGTNVFIVGKGKRRVMIDAGDIRSASNELVALRNFLNDFDVIIDVSMLLSTENIHHPLPHRPLFSGIRANRLLRL